ncbi:MAG: hypothetical protein HN919_20745 [Verrucomicrobia bacterium]|jgi:hypothetical protein|nr:hypothetical protein [Verrucomicrobiota bacterium]MBT7068735.1 hypothetical protein [Verrucomicrobiota bacterium]MBT7702015.1 hypothetical protein [Verrucomicrobiota bacterium]
MEKLIRLFAVLGVVLALAPAAQAGIVVPTDGYTGPYRIVFCTLGSYDALLTNVADYNARVEAEAASTVGLTYDVSDITGWKIIGSTVGMNARTNTGTTATNGLAASGDVPIYNVLGERVADGNAALWGTTLAPYNGIPPDYYVPNAESLLAVIALINGSTAGGRTWSGTRTDGTTQTGNELGTVVLTTQAYPTVAQADARRKDAGWISWGGNGNPNTAAANYRHYGLSPVVGGPTPGTMYYTK